MFLFLLVCLPSFWSVGVRSEFLLEYACEAFELEVLAEDVIGVVIQQGSVPYEFSLVDERGFVVVSAHSLIRMGLHVSGP